MTTEDIAAFVAAHPPHPGFSADQIADVWDELSSVADVEVIATDTSDRETRSTLEHAAAYRRQLAAAVRWVKAHHGDEVANSFVTYLGNASSRRGAHAIPPAP
ncbi:hypothetical protein [Streptomyces sp. NPDC007346]|uniref:hypothetical protein n=1 Tax=Streptomyces sp. NPDC007346 TaxID=3154682 RepID=UPI0034566340